MNLVEDEREGSEDSLLCLHVVRRDRKLLTSVVTKVNGNRKQTRFQLDTGASCNILNHTDYIDLGKPSLDGNRKQLRQFDGSTTRALGGCEVEVAGKTFYFLVHKTRNHSLLSLDACLDLGLISMKDEWVTLVSGDNFQEILKSYPDVFEGIGCLPGEYHIEVDK